MSIFRDQSNQFSINDILKSKIPLFTPIGPRGILGLGFTSDTIWLRMQLHVNKPIPRDPSFKSGVFIGTERPEFYRMNVYMVNIDGSIKKLRHGTSVKKNARAGPFRIGYLPLPIKNTDRIEIFIELKSHMPIVADFHLLLSQEAIGAATRANITQYLFFGSLLLLCLFSFAFYIYTREPIFIYYLFFGLSLVASIFFFSGFIEYFDIWPGVLNSGQYLYIQLLPAIFSALYLRSFLELATKDRMMNLAAIILAGCAFAMTIWFWIYPKIDYLFLGDIIQGANIILVISAALRALTRGQDYALYYLAGWGSFSAFVFFWLLGQNGIIEKSYLVAFSPLFGNWVEMLGSAAGMGAKLKNLNQMKNKLNIQKEEERHLRSMMRVVCHDVANPLTVILGVCEIVDLKGHSQPHHWQKVRAAGEGIARIVDQVKRHAAADSAKFTPNMTYFPIKDLFIDLNLIFEKRLKEKNIELVYKYPQNESEIYADKNALLYDVLSNFLSNSIKFSSEHSTIEIVAAQNDQFWQLKVIDQGVGIPDKLMEKLFKEGEKTSRLGTAGEVGTGFGMQLAKYFIETMNGDLKIASKEIEKYPHNHGTTAVIKLLAAANQKTALSEKDSKNIY